MLVFRRITENIVINLKQNPISGLSKRLLSYSSIPYDERQDPRPLFFNKEIQEYLRNLTRIDLNKVYRKRKLGQKRLADPEYKFMTDEELEASRAEAQRKLTELLQVPPAVPVRSSITRIFSRDPQLQGLNTSKFVFTDITFGTRDRDRLITIREPDGTLREADWETRRRINQVYFPKSIRSIKPPRMFENDYFENLLAKKEYVFILDNACVQFEPDDPEYQRIVSITYQHMNDHGTFDLLRSTRHFGALAFFLVWNKSLDNLLLDLIETAHIEEANTLLELYSKVHDVRFEGDGHLKGIENYIRDYSKKKGILELGLQAYKDLEKQRQKLEKGLKSAHGIN